MGLSSRLVLRITIPKRTRDSLVRSCSQATPAPISRSASLLTRSTRTRSSRGRSTSMFDLEYLKKFNKDKKQIKSWAKKYSMLIASDTVLKKVPVVCGPILNRIQRFPQVVTHAEPLDAKVSDLRSSVKWQLKKVTCLNAAVGKEDMTDEELRVNVMMAINFLISLLKKGWHNMKSVNIKTTMSKAVKLL